MKKSKRHLIALLNTAQKAQSSIRSVLKTTIRTDLRELLRDQLVELDCVVSQAYSIAVTRGWELKEAGSMARIAAKLMTMIHLIYTGTDSSIAAMMVRRSTQSMICGLHVLNCSMETDRQISALSQQLVDCTTANIRQMQGFL